MSGESKHQNGVEGEDAEEAADDVDEKDEPEEDDDYEMEDVEEEDDESSANYCRKSYNETERIKRALSQTMYLLQHQVKVRAGNNGKRDRRQFVFHVEGTTGNRYLVRISYRVSGSKEESGDCSCTCTCPDFQERRYRCKHLYFVLFRGLGFADGSNPTKRAIVEAAEQFFAKRKAAEEKHKHAVGGDVKQHVQVEPRSYIGESCPVCLDDMTASCKVVTCLRGHSAHRHCYQKWSKFKANVNCVLCRGEL